MSPYEQTFVDVKFGDGVSGSVTVSLDEGQVFKCLYFSPFAQSVSVFALTFYVVCSATKMALHIASCGICFTVFGTICQ